MNRTDTKIINEMFTSEVMEKIKTQCEVKKCSERGVFEDGKLITTAPRGMEKPRETNVKETMIKLGMMLPDNSIRYTAPGPIGEAMYTLVSEWCNKGTIKQEDYTKVIRTPYINEHGYRKFHVKEVVVKGKELPLGKQLFKTFRDIHDPKNETISDLKRRMKSLKQELQSLIHNTTVINEGTRVQVEDDGTWIDGVIAVIHYDGLVTVNLDTDEVKCIQLSHVRLLDDEGQSDFLDLRDEVSRLTEEITELEKVLLKFKDCDEKQPLGQLAYSFPAHALFAPFRDEKTGECGFTLKNVFDVSHKAFSLFSKRYTADSKDAIMQLIPLMYIPGILGIAGSDLSEEAEADTDTKELLREGNGYDINNSDLSTLLFEQTNRVGHLQRILSGYSDTRDKNELLVRTLSKYNAIFSVEPIIQAILHQSKLKASLYCKPAKGFETILNEYLNSFKYTITKNVGRVDEHTVTRTHGKTNPRDLIDWVNNTHMCAYPVDHLNMPDYMTPVIGADGYYYCVITEEQIRITQYVYSGHFTMEKVWIGNGYVMKPPSPLSESPYSSY